MSSTTPVLIKTCNACGLQKPIIAFLQMSGPEGSTYGTICATCRAAGKNKATNISDADETTKSKSGHGIDSKKKLESDKINREERERTEEEYHEDRDEMEELQVKQTEKADIKTKDEIKHRDLLKYRSFLRTDKKTAPVSGAQQNNERVAKQAHFSEESAKQERAATAEQREKTDNFSISGPNTEMGHQLKRGTGFYSHITQIGSSSSANRTFLQGAQKSQTPAGKASDKPATGKDPLVEFADDNWKKPPGGGRRF